MLGSDKEHQANSQHQAKLDILVGYFSHAIKNLQDLHPIRARGPESARTFFKRPFLHEKRGLELSPPALKQHPEAPPY